MYDAEQAEAEQLPESLTTEGYAPLVVSPLAVVGITVALFAVAIYRFQRMVV